VRDLFNVDTVRDLINVDAVRDLFNVDAVRDLFNVDAVRDLFNVDAVCDLFSMSKGKTVKMSALSRTSQDRGVTYEEALGATCSAGVNTASELGSRLLCGATRL
jgi:hypothetical protein